jgi:hypothetical protein
MPGAVETAILLVIVLFVILAAYAWRARSRGSAGSGARTPEPIHMPSQAHPIAPEAVEAAASAAVASDPMPSAASTDGRRADGSRGSY